MDIKKVALITGYGWAGVTVSLAMCVQYFQSKGFIVDVYLQEDLVCDKIGLNKPLFNTNNTNIFFYKERENDAHFINFNNLKTRQSDLNFVQFIRTKKIKYKATIGFDTVGMIRAGIYNKLEKTPFYYFSLEFYEKNDFIKELEIFYSQRCIAIMTQDKYRGKILSKLLKVNINEIKTVYNTTIGEVINSKNNYLKNKFSIPQHKKIILSSGTLLDITGFDIILKTIPNMKEEYVLVAHGWTTDKEIRNQINHYKKVYPEKFFYSNEILPHEEKFKVFSSADIGLIFYKPINLNLKYAAWSSGKFFDFMRCGVPVIANQLPNMRKLIADNKVGYVEDDFSNIVNIYDKILDAQESYKKQCFKTFEKYVFEKTFSNAINEIL